MNMDGFPDILVSNSGSDTLSYVGDCTYLIVEFIVTCHKSKFTEKYKGCQIMVVRG